MKESLQNEIILILGGTGGIGSAIGDVLEKAGARVCRHGREGEFAADVREEKNTKALVEKVIGQFGRIDIIVNSLTSPIKFARLEEKVWSDFLDQFNIQLKTAADILKYAVPQMKKQGGGKFINIISSVVEGAPPKMYADYITSKYALLGFSKCMAEELKRYNIETRWSSPGFVKTGLTKAFPEKILEMVPVQTAEEVAEEVLNLIYG